MKKGFLVSIMIILCGAIIVVLGKTIIREVNAVLEGMHSEEWRWTYP